MKKSKIEEINNNIDYLKGRAKEADEMQAKLSLLDGSLKSTEEINKSLNDVIKSHEKEIKKLKEELKKEKYRYDILNTQKINLERNIKELEDQVKLRNTIDSDINDSYKENASMKKEMSRLKKIQSETQAVNNVLEENNKAYSKGFVRIQNEAKKLEKEIIKLENECKAKDKKINDLEKMNNEKGHFGMDFNERINIEIDAYRTAKQEALEMLIQQVGGPESLWQDPLLISEIYKVAEDVSREVIGFIKNQDSMSLLEEKYNNTKLENETLKEKVKALIQLNDDYVKKSKEYHNQSVSFLARVNQLEKEKEEACVLLNKIREKYDILDKKSIHLSNICRALDRNVYLGTLTKMSSYANKYNMNIEELIRFAKSFGFIGVKENKLIIEEKGLNYIDSDKELMLTPLGVAFFDKILRY